MREPILDWTHKGLKLSDIRKLNKLYAIHLHNALSVLFVKDTIFEERLKAYFLKDVSKISREEILGVKWNLYITKGHYVKIDEAGNVVQYVHDPDKWYISYLEIDGDLGTFSTILKDKEQLKEK
jgi:hypothetical protein